ncbi:MAG: universal stress protein [Deltaproteobacteria bacterium]|nr:universal stress protein [Deltaproteobacteria bacterium]
MATFKHLLVPVDTDVTGDRPLAEHLVDAAADVAKALGAKVTLAHVALPVVEPGVLPVDGYSVAYRAMNDVLEARNASASRALASLMERCGQRGVATETMLITRGGSVPERIVDAAAERGADLIVLATHGRRGVSRLVLGSVAERTAHLASKNGGPAVLLIPAGA